MLAECDAILEGLLVDFSSAEGVDVAFGDGGFNVKTTATSRGAVDAFFNTQCVGCRRVSVDNAVVYFV